MSFALAFVFWRYEAQKMRPSAANPRPAKCHGIKIFLSVSEVDNTVNKKAL